MSSLSRQEAAAVAPVVVTVSVRRCGYEASCCLDKASDRV
jgi:hypothetical protein